MIFENILIKKRMKEIISENILIVVKNVRNDKTIMHLAAINNRAEVILLLLSADGGEDLVNTNDQVMMNNLFNLTTESI